MTINTKHAAADLIKPLASALPQEQEAFFALALDARLMPIGKPWLVALGTANRCDVHPRDIFREAIRRNAVSILVSHNHPTGNQRFSADDVSLTRKLEQAAELLGVSLTDHILLAGEGVYSWQEEKSTYCNS